MGSVRVAIVGVGNCATSLIQGVEYYKDADPAGSVPGLMHVKFGEYHVSDVEFVAAFDVDAKKVGFDLSDAINNSENNTIKIAEVPPTGVIVQRGPTLDGLGKYYRETIDESDADPVDVVILDLRMPLVERFSRVQVQALDYLNHLAIYNCGNTLTHLEGTGILCPRFDTYVDALISYVRESIRKDRPRRTPRRRSADPLDS